MVKLVKLHLIILLFSDPCLCTIFSITDSDLHLSEIAFVSHQVLNCDQSQCNFYL